MTGKKLISMPLDDDEGELPNLVEDIRVYFGDEIADKVITNFGGVRLTVPSAEKLTEGHAFVKILGMETAKAICELLLPAETRFEFVVPLNRANGAVALRKRIRELLQRGGQSTRQIALCCGVHERTVWRERSRMKKTGIPLGKSVANKTYRDIASNAVLFEEELVRLVEILLLEGFSPSLLQQYLRVGGSVITTIRNRLIKEGRLDIGQSS